MKRIQLNLPALAKRKAHREGRSITKYVIAKETGLAFNTVVAYWENTVQSVNIEVAQTLCSYLECSVSELITEKEELAVA